MSKRTQSKAGKRRAAVAASKAVHGDGCGLAWHSPCVGGVNGHEIVPRSAWAEGKYEPVNIVPLCNGHNTWVSDNPAEAKALGWDCPRWVLDRYGLAVVVEECGRARSERDATRGPWWDRWA